MRTSSEIGKLVKNLRTKKGISISEFADKIGVNKSTISRYENGSRKIPMEDIAKFANVLDVKPDFLLLKNKKEESQETIAAHANKDEFTPEEWDEIERFIQWVRERDK
ncbi:helix-turn-helix domain-containing protein [Staphylococcus coagulans]|uniref:helix-turn-helix domain-containing protein n=1 Tax=Staphylococcus coagulans TaxID=74706 RepID=UPI003364F6DA